MKKREDTGTSMPLAMEANGLIMIAQNKAIGALMMEAATQAHGGI